MVSNTSQIEKNMLFSWTPIDATSCFHHHPHIRPKPEVVCCSISIGNKSVVFFQHDPQMDRASLKRELSRYA